MSQNYLLTKHATADVKSSLSAVVSIFANGQGNGTLVAIILISICKSTVLYTYLKIQE